MNSRVTIVSGKKLLWLHPYRYILYLFREVHNMFINFPSFSPGVHPFSIVSLRSSSMFHHFPKVFIHVPSSAQGFHPCSIICPRFSSMFHHFPKVFWKLPPFISTRAADTTSWRCWKTGWRPRCWRSWWMGFEAWIKSRRTWNWEDSLRIVDTEL